VSERPFLGKAQKPDIAGLKVALGPAFAFHHDLTDLCHGFRQEWVHTKGSGWMLRVADSKKALLYVIPLEGAFRVSMAVRESERSVLLQSGRMSDYRALLDSARKFAEGYSVVFEVAEAASYDHCRRFVCRIIEERR
jgi:hypothetical protein